MSNIVCFAIIPTLPVDRQRGVAPRTRVDYKIMKKLIIVSGLTTTGKSNLAYELAKKYNTQIITADQMQMYSNWKISSNWPKISERHLLIGQHDAHKVQLTSAIYKSQVSEEIRKLELPILEGGCCFYLKYLLTSSQDVYTNEQIMAVDQQAQELLEQNKENLQGLLKRMCPAYDYSLESSDKYRMLKALKYILLTNGERFTNPSQQGKRLIDEYDVRGIFLVGKQIEINQRIYARCDEMLRMGMLEEFYQFYQESLKQGSSNHSVALAYNEFIELIKGEGRFRYLSEEQYEIERQKEVVKAIQDFYIKSRKYAGYQRKYAKNNFEFLVWINFNEGNLLRKIVNLIEMPRSQFDSLISSFEQRHLRADKYGMSERKLPEVIPSQEIVKLVQQQIQKLLA